MIDRVQKTLDNESGLVIAINVDNRGATIEDMSGNRTGRRSIATGGKQAIEHWTPNGRVRVTVEHF